jgi:hypothetical protein
LLITGALIAAGFFTGAAALTTLVVFAAGLRPGFVAFAAGLAGFFGAAFAMIRNSFIELAIRLSTKHFG